MSTSERVSWLLAVFLCVILPALLSYWDCVAGGAGGLAVLWWMFTPWKAGEESHVPGPGAADGGAARRDKGGGSRGHEGKRQRKTGPY